MGGWEMERYFCCIFVKKIEVSVNWVKRKVISKNHIIQKNYASPTAL